MKEVVVSRWTAVTIDGRTCVREIKYQGQIDGMGKLHPVRCVGRFFSPRHPQAATPVKKEAA